jgi:hypothetical protein
MSEVFRSFRVFTAVFAGPMTAGDEMVGGDEKAGADDTAGVDETVGEAGSGPMEAETSGVRTTGAVTVAVTVEAELHALSLA